MWKAIWKWIFPYRFDPRNPARRWCKHCGQQQDLYGVNFEDGFRPTGWENMRRIERDCPRFGDHSENGL
jgi:hypothetical protein